MIFLDGGLYSEGTYRFLDPVVEIRTTILVLEKSRRISQAHQTVLPEELELKSVWNYATTLATESGVTCVSRENRSNNYSQPSDATSATRTLHMLGRQPPHQQS